MLLLPLRPVVAHSGFEVRGDKMPPVSVLAALDPSRQLTDVPFVEQDITGRSSTWVTNASAHFYLPQDSQHQSSIPLCVEAYQQSSNLHLLGIHSPVSEFNTPQLSHSAFSAWSDSTGCSSSVGSYVAHDVYGNASSYTPSSSGHVELDQHMQDRPIHPSKRTDSISAIPSSSSQQTIYGSLPSPPPHHPISQTQLINFLTPLFPYHATIAIACSRLLEIVLPHAAPVLIGAVIDLPAHSHGPDPRRPGKLRIDPGGRTVYLSLPPFSPSKTDSQMDVDGADHGNLDIDIRDHLTSLLDLVADALEALELVLVLDRRNRQDEELREFLHALAYVGGVVLRPGKVRGGFEWDDKRWVLVAIEL